MFTICFDTICTGFAPVHEDEKPIRFKTKAEAQREIDSDLEFYADCFVAPLSNIGHEAIFTGSN